MEGLIVRVERNGDNTTHLFQVPGNIEIGLLSRMVSRTLNWDNNRAGQPSYRVEAKQLGRVVQDGETLDRAGILDNCLLVFHGDDNWRTSSQADSNTVNLKSSANAAPALSSLPSKPEVPANVVKTPEEPPKPAAQAPVELKPADSNTSPVSGWRTLDFEVPPASPSFSENSGEQKSDTGFVWKKLD